MSPSHRARRTARGLARSLAGPVLAVGGVLALVGALLFLNGRPGLGNGTAPVVAARGGGRPASLSPAPAAADAAAPSLPPAPPPSSSPAPLPPLTVLNNSRITGLAARAAVTFRAGGWPVAVIGNFRGLIPATTVYYPPGEQAVAQQLAARFPRVTRVLPRFAGLPGSGLTVVLTRYWLDSDG